MYRTFKPRFWLSLIALLIGIPLMSQDIHFSQFANSPLNLNPALTGAFDGDYRFKSSFRNQWQTPVPYNTFTISAEKNFCTVKCDSSNCWRPEGFSLGALFNYDVAGDSKLSLTQLELAASYNKYIGSGFSLAGALMLGGGQRAFSRSDLRLENPNDPSNGGSKDREARFLFDISTGANLHYQACEKRHSFDFGAGIFHLNQPRTNFFDVLDINLPTRFSIYGVGAFQLFNDLDLLINTLMQFQGPYQEIVLGAGGRIHSFSKDPGSFILDLNLGYRLDDALIITTEFHLNMWRFGISYDFTTSQAADFLNDGNGGVEFTVGHIISRPSPVRACKVQF